jgi:hypothetical protein
MTKKYQTRGAECNKIQLDVSKELSDAGIMSSHPYGLGGLNAGYAIGYVSELSNLYQTCQMSYLAPSLDGKGSEKFKGSSQY